MTEDQFQRTVIEAARALGWLAYHTHDSRRSAAGFPDLVLVRDRVLFVELKTDKGKLSPDQVAWGRALMKAMGVTYCLWRPQDWPQIELQLRARYDEEVLRG